MSNTLCNRDYPYVISGDIHGLLKRWAQTRNLTIPPLSFFKEMAERRADKIRQYFRLHPEHLHEDELAIGVQEKLNESDLPVVALDQNYTNGAGVPFEVTRLCDPETLEQDDVLGSRNGESIPSQLDRVAAALGPVAVQIADDVIFSGKNLAHNLIPALKERGITVSRIVAGVVIGKGRITINTRWFEIEVVPIRYYPEVYDEICERDFLAGMPQGGRLFGKNGLPLFPKVCAPYFHPFARAANNGKCFMKDWATLDSVAMPDEVRKWSRFCLEQSIELWREIEEISGRLVHCRELERRPWGVPCDDSRFADHLERILVEMA